MIRSRWWTALGAAWLAGTAASAGMGSVAPAAGALPAGDPGRAEQWGLSQIGAEAAWLEASGNGIRIGIVDTGVDLEHEDLAGKVVAHTSCLATAGDPAACHGSGQDDHGHGTHLAGVAAARRGNGLGVAGVAPEASLVVAKVMTRAGIGTGPDVMAGIRWVVDHGARVVNLSLSDPELTILAADGPAFHDALGYVAAHDAVAVLSSGTSARFAAGRKVYDRDFRAVVVGATDQDRRQSPLSVPTGGALLGVLAPGGSAAGDPATGVLSTYWRPNQSHAYESLAGTSVAAAFASGALAVLLSEGYGSWAAVERLLLTADGTIATDEASPSCYGLIDLAAATAGGPPPPA